MNYVFGGIKEVSNAVKIAWSSASVKALFTDGMNQDDKIRIIDSANAVNLADRHMTLHMVKLLLPGDQFANGRHTIIDAVAQFRLRNGLSHICDSRGYGYR
jgi:hypothetical protein